MNEITQKAFWMVWTPSGFPPNYKHESEHGAIQEAERLARINRGSTFIVLRATAARRSDDLIRINLDPDSAIPF